MTRVAIFTFQIGHYHDARFLAASKFLDDVTVIVFQNEGGFAEFTVKESAGYAVERLYQDQGAFESAMTNGTIGPAVAACLDRLRPEAIAIPGWSNPTSVAAIEWAQANDIPLVMMSESQADDADRNLVREWLKSRIVSLCDTALVGGPSHAKYLEKLGMPADRIFLGYNAVGNQHFASRAQAARNDSVELRREHGLPDRYILASARFIHKKNLPNLVSAYARARDALDGNAPDLVILGDGEERGEIEKVITEASITEHVHLPSFRGYDVLPIFYGLAEGFVHVSTVEQWGLVVNEAMACGLPVVVSEQCGVGRAIVQDGVNGFIVKPDVASIGNALEHLFRLSADERRAIGDRAAATIADWGPERFGRGLRDAVAGALNIARRSRISILHKVVMSIMRKRNVDAVS